MGLPRHDPLHSMKVELLHQHSMTTINDSGSVGSSFTIKLVLILCLSFVPYALHVFVNKYLYADAI